LGGGHGTVTSSPAGISCDTDTTTCSSGNATFSSGSQVILYATAKPGSIFAGWSDNACSGLSCTVTMNAAQTVTATFNTIGAASKLVYSVQPVSTVAGVAIPDIKVQIQDASGNLVTTAANTVTLAIGTNPATRKTKRHCR
jgi:hypothetical protein